MSTHPRLQQAALQVVDTQIRDHHPPETKQAYDQLTAAGHGHDEARKLICVVVLEEMVAVLQENRTFDVERYTAELKKLVEEYTEGNV